MCGNAVFVWSELWTWVQGNPQNSHEFAKLMRGSSGKNAEIEGELWMIIIWSEGVEGRDLGDLQRNTLILQMTGTDGNITEGNCCQRNGKNTSCILREVSFTAFSFGCNFIEFQRFHSSSQGEICTRRTVLWQRISVNLIKIQPFKAQGMNVIAGNISWS